MDVRPEHLARSDDFRANETELKSTLPENMPVKIDLGCAFRKPDGYWGTDVKPFRGVDQVFDHAKLPWPLPTRWSSGCWCSSPEPDSTTPHHVHLSSIKHPFSAERRLSLYRVEIFQ